MISNSKVNKKEVDQLSEKHSLQNSLQLCYLTWNIAIMHWTQERKEYPNDVIEYITHAINSKDNWDNNIKYFRVKLKGAILPLAY